MTPHERFLAYMRFTSVDHVPLWEWGPWKSTLRRWQREALGPGGEPPQLAECDVRDRCPDFWMLPRFEPAVLAEDDEYVTVRTERGVIQKSPKSPDTMSMPQHIEYPVKTRADWEELKQRFDPDDPARLGADWEQRCAAWRQEGPVLLFQGARAPSLFGFVRELMGPERTLYAFYDEPDLVHDMMEYNAEFVTCVLRRVLDAGTPLTALFFWEDMSYKGGPLISPAMFRRFMIPRYRRITDLARSRGIDNIFVDSDGDVSLLIPLWLEAGINGVYPMEVAAGMDVLKLRGTYGRDLLMTGGLDKRVLAQDRAAIDAELEAKVPLAHQGGYIPHIDHAIPHDVPYHNFAYYWERKKALLGIT